MQQVFTVLSGALISDIWNYIDPTTADLYRSGYTFTNWNTVASGISGTTYNPGDTYTVAADLTLYAQWTPNNYTLSYSGNGVSGSMSSQTFTVLSTNNVAANSFSVPAGKKFVGWNTKSDGTGISYIPTNTYAIPGNATLYAIWEDTSKVSVVYNINGGDSGISPLTQTVNSGLSVRIASGSGFSRAGYTFTGWNEAANGSGTSHSVNSTYVVTGDITLYAQWSANTYTLSYNANGGSGSLPSNQSFTVAAGAVVGSATLTRTGYTFDGWWNSSSSGVGSTTLKVGDTYSDPSDLTLYALWTPIDYTITYDANGGFGLTPQDQNFNVENWPTIASGTDTLFRPGYTFKGWWNTQADGAGTQSYVGGDVYKTAADLTLYAVWVPINYSVFYDKNGATGTNPAKQDFTMSGAGALINDGSSISRAGYTFDGWNTQADGTGTDFNAGDTYQDVYDLTLYAQWTPIEYTLVYDANGGSGTIPGDQTFTVDGPGVTIVDATTGGYSLSRTGYTFKGWWNTATDGSGTLSFVAGDIYNDPSNIVLYAVWVPVGQNSILYDVNGGTGSAPVTQFFSAPSAVSILPAPTDMVRAGYTFGGWYDAKSGGTKHDVDSHPAAGSDLALYAHWTPVAYAFKYDGNHNTGGSTPADGAYTGGGATYAVSGNSGNLVRTGYNFLGWNTAANGSGDDYLGGDSFTVTTTTPGTVTFYAQWDPIEYAVFYDDNGADGGTAPADTTFTLDNPAHISDSDLTLGGTRYKSWNTAADGSGTKFTAGMIYSTAVDLTLYAIYTSSNNGGGGYYVPPSPPTPVTPPATTLTTPPSGSASGSSTTPSTGNTVNINGSIKTHAAAKKVIPNQLVKVIQLITLDTLPDATITSVLVNGKPVDAKILPNGQVQLTSLVGPKDTVVVAEKVNGQEVDVPVQEVNNPISLANVNFDLASSDLTPAAKKILDKVAAVIKAHGFTYVDLSGHTDVQGSGSYDNQTLSHARAVKVRAYLRQKLSGLHVQIVVEAKAEFDPLVKKQSQDAFSLNRRVEIVVK